MNMIITRLSNKKKVFLFRPKKNLNENNIVGKLI